MRRLSRARLFFLELVLDLIFFFLCVAVCLLVFAQAARYDRDGRALDHAVLLAQSTAETYRAVDGDLDALATQLDLIQQDGAYFARYAADWTPAPQGSAPTFLLTVTAAARDGLSMGTVDVLRYAADGDPVPVFQLPLTLATGEVTP